MDFLYPEEIEGTDGGRRFYHDDILKRLHPEVLVDASATYAKLVADHPNFEIGMVRDEVKGGITIYWRRIM